MHLLKEGWTHLAGRLALGPPRSKHTSHCAAVQLKGISYYSFSSGFPGAIQWRQVVCKSHTPGRSRNHNDRS